MGWNIEVVENTIELTEAQMTELFKVKTVWMHFGLDGPVDDINEHFYIEDGVSLLPIDDDAMEHKNYIAYPEVQKFLKSIKAKGDICFGSLEGDNAGEHWGYRFDGKGGAKFLQGTIVFKEAGKL